MHRSKKQQVCKFLGQMHKDVSNLDNAYAIYQKALALVPKNETI